LLPGVRSWAARVLPLHPRSFVHAVALSLVCGLAVLSFGQLAAAWGRPLLLELARRSPDFAASTKPPDLLFGLAWTVAGVVVAVGFPGTRGWGQALTRLGLVRPTGMQMLAALGLSVALVGAMVGCDACLTVLHREFGLPRTDSATFEKLLAPLVSPSGALIIGVTAGIGEELAIRGALQPRLGLWLPNLLFTSLHAYQYGFDGLLSVFLIGTAMAVIRDRTNTTVCCLVHGLYDFILVMGSFLEKKGGS
jgi:membrane protease YdiL (CAAX protease family)